LVSPFISKHPAKDVLPIWAHDELKKTDPQSQNVYAWKGTFHSSANYLRWYRWANLQMSPIEIKEEARKLRELKKMGK
jgi:hypothetical protein